MKTTKNVISWNFETENRETRLGYCKQEQGQRQINNMPFVKERRQKTEKKTIKTFFSSNTENMENHNENSANDQ